MKNILQLIAVLFVCAMITSCQKNPVNALITSHDSVTLLSQFIFIDTRVSATDTTGYYKYQYDSLQRVTTINIYDYISGTSSLSTVFTFYYHGSEGLAYKKTEVSADPSDMYSYATFYFYDNLQRLIKDSALYGTDVNVNQYKYTGMQITTSGSFIYSNDPVNPLNEADTGYVGSNGDVVKTNSLTFDSEYYTNNFTFDNHPNPFSQLNIHTTYNPMPGYNFIYMILCCKKITR